jgi:hypothetical protein
MEVAELRPKLVSFRATSFHGENKDASDPHRQWTFQLTQTIEVGLAVAENQSATLQAIVKIDLEAKALMDGEPNQTADFSGKYEAKFVYPPDTKEAEVAPVFEQEPHQYILASQAFPLAMTHFRRELQAMGFDARQMPLGL